VAQEDEAPIKHEAPITQEVPIILPPPRFAVASVEGTMAQPAQPPPRQPDRTAGEGKPGGRRGGEASALRVIAKGFSWVTASQLLTAGGNLVLTPFVIHGLGIQRYGLFVLTGTITAFLGSLNGGLGGAAARYFPVYAGADDRTATTRLLVTFLMVVLGVGFVLSIVDWFVSPYIVRALSMTPSLRPESLFLFRTMGAVFTLSFAHQLIQSVILARQRFDRAIQAGFLCWCLWVVGLVIVVKDNLGLRGIAVVFLVQQFATTVVIWPTAVKYLARDGLHLLPWVEFKEVFSFSAKIQVTGLAALVNQQIDTLLVGSALSVRTVGIYNAGNSFSGQLSGVMSNVLSPAAVHLGNTYGREGPEATFRRFNRMQRAWVQAVTGWTAVGAAAAYFGVTAWLGPQFKLGAWVAVICAGGAMAGLGVALMTVYVAIIRQAGIEMRYGLVQMVVNLVLTIPMVAFGAIAVAAAAAAAQVVGALYLVAAVKRRVRADAPNFLRQMPIARGLVAAGVTLLLEFVVKPHVRVGPIGLLECVPPALVGLAVYAVLVAGARRCLAFAGAAFRERRIPRQFFGGAAQVGGGLSAGGA